MGISYTQWCTQNSNVLPLVRTLKSPMPEQYIGFYLEKALSEEIEYQKQFPWLGNDRIKITAQTEKASHPVNSRCEAFLLGDTKKKIPIHMSVLWYHKYDIYML